MTDIRQIKNTSVYPSETTSVWRITFAPLVWALHFAISYGATALVCAKGGHVGALRLGLGGVTAVALLAIIWLAWRAWRHWDIVRDRDWENDAGTNEDRHQFLGHAAFLLAIISFIGVAYVSLPPLLIQTCQ
ncbi:MAG: hypothetical protein ACU0CQ_17785 [Sulfitobacter sp.]|jgi:lysylphosphatidylglycerol synthetase-like protein (DUF2156 family)|uniref:hypothetical protein n=1 Tax=Sulfitobacter sp. TaxID=1903071 RepID=UPI00405A0675